MALHGYMVSLLGIVMNEAQLKHLIEAINELSVYIAFSDAYTDEQVRHYNSVLSEANVVINKISIEYPQLFNTLVEIPAKPLPVRRNTRRRR